MLSGSQKTALKAMFEPDPVPEYVVETCELAQRLVANLGGGPLPTHLLCVTAACARPRVGRKKKEDLTDGG